MQNQMRIPMYILLKISWIHQHRKNTDEFTRNLDRNSHVLPLLTCRGRIFNVVRYVSRVFIIQIVAKSFNCIINDGRQHDDDLTWFSESKPVIYRMIELGKYNFLRHFLSGSFFPHSAVQPISAMGCNIGNCGRFRKRPFKNCPDILLFWNAMLWYNRN